MWQIGWRKNLTPIGTLIIQFLNRFIIEAAPPFRALFERVGTMNPHGAVRGSAYPR